MDKISTVAHFPFELDCEDYTILDQSVEKFEHGLDSFLTDSIETLELDASFDDCDVITSSSVFWVPLLKLVKIH